MIDVAGAAEKSGTVQVGHQIIAIDNKVRSGWMFWFREQFTFTV
jgi:hypothetical protein